MCLLIVLKNPVPGIALAIAHNRDEYSERAFSPMAMHRNNIFCGLDQTAGGTWLGFQANQTWAAVLNIRTKVQTPNVTNTRGALPIRCLKDPNFFNKIDAEHSSFKPFTVLGGSRHREIKLYSSLNRRYESIKVADYFCISNNAFGTEWKKASRVSESLKLEKPKSAQQLKDLLTKMMKSREQLDKNNLPVTGYDISIEQELSSNFVQIRNYQTVLTTIAFMHDSGITEIFEKNHITLQEVKHELSPQASTSTCQPIKLSCVCRKRI